MSQHELQEQIIHQLFWTGGETLFSRQVMHGMLLDAFPQLQSDPGFVAKGIAEPQELLSLLFKSGDYAEAKQFFARLVDAKPADNDPTWVTASLNRLATEAVFNMTYHAAEWKTSDFRSAYLDMIEISERLWCYADKVYQNNLKQPDVQGQAYYCDLELYKVCIEHAPDKLHRFSTDHWKSVLAPALQGDFEFQDYIFDQLLEKTRSKTLQKVDLDLGANYFWRDIRGDLAKLGNDQQRVMEKLLAVAFKVFSPDNAVDIKKQLSTKRFRQMIVGAPLLLLDAKEAGIPMSFDLYRGALKPLEKAALTAKRAWKGVLGQDEWVAFQDSLQRLLDGVDVQKIYPRKMSDTTVSVFAEVMPQCGWMEKASEAGCADILMDDLGL